MKLLLVLIMLITNTARAGEYRLLSLEQFDLSYQEFKINRDPYVPDTSHWKYRASTTFRIGIADTLYWHNNLHTEAVANGTVKTVGWHWIVGLRVSKYIDLFAEHHSRHVMEEYRPTRDGRNTFPVEDSIGIRFKIINDTKPKTIGDWFN